MLTKGAAELFLGGNGGQPSLCHVAVVQVHIGHPLQQGVLGVISDLCPQESMLNLFWYRVIFKSRSKWDFRYGNLKRSIELFSQLHSQKCTTVFKTVRDALVYLC